MVQNKELEEKVLTNGENKTEANEQCENVKADEIETNGHVSDEEESDDDDYLDHLLMLPQLDTNTSDRNKSFVSQCLLDFCTAIESRKEYQKIKQELLDSCLPIEIKQEEEELLAVDDQVLETNLNGKDESPEVETESEAIEVKIEAEVVEIRRQSIRLNKAKFGKLYSSKILQVF